MLALREYYDQCNRKEYPQPERPIFSHLEAPRFKGFVLPEFVTTRTGKKYRVRKGQKVIINAKGYEAVWAVQRKFNVRKCMEVDFGPQRLIRVERTDIFDLDGTCKFVPAGQE
jgi:hypothetical protein